MNKIKLETQKLIYKNALFDLIVETTAQETSILMKTKSSHINTQGLPQTYDILQNKLPSVLNTKCFNGMGLPFCEEVKHTEVGHLFEHILIAYLCLARELTCLGECVYSGQTNWNWLEDNEGTFYITVTAGLKDLDILQDALEKSIALTLEILTSPALVKTKVDVS